MFEIEFPVLVVDDDPDVLAVSRLALKNVTIYGVPLKVYTAASKTEAVEVIEANFVNQYTTSASKLAVFFIDVVMEKDHAGLELCKYIRQDLNNKGTQLYIRTGQPGTAPERRVIDEYDINGYFTKVEMTEDKLYSMVKSGIRQHYYMNYSWTYSSLLVNALPLAGSRQQLAHFYSTVTAASQTTTDGQKVKGHEVITIAEMDPGFNFAYGVSEEEGRAMLDEMKALPGTPIGDSGDCFFVRDTSIFIHIAPSPPQRNITIWLLGRLSRQISWCS